MFGARFDDIINGESFTLTGGVDTLAARAIHEVTDVLRAAQKAASEGYWVAGYLTYEAAAAFNRSFIVRDSERDVFAWFGVFAGREEVPAAVHNPADSGTYVVSQWRPRIDRNRYGEAFQEIQRHLLDGDTHQVYLTFPLDAAFTGDADVFYNDLVCAQRPRYAAHLWHDDSHLLSVSPERFFTVSGRDILTQPMKGTSPRGKTMEEDLQFKDALIASEKDIAENRMIVDLIVNDLSKVAHEGSITKEDLLSVERYRTVWQMTSTVKARLLDDVTLLDTFASLFPCASVTGSPKAPSMEIIADVEQGPRGAYCGAVGFIPPGDGLDGASFSVAIRTVEINDAEGVARYGVGGGVTSDSTVDNEFDEAVTKFEVLRFDVSPMALTESIRWDDDWHWLDEHLDRLEASAKYWSLGFDRAGLEQKLADAASSFVAPSTVRITSDPNGHSSITVEEAARRWANVPGPAVDPVTLSIDTEPIDDSNPRMYHKTSDRRVYDVRLARHPESDDVLMVNRVGNVTCSTDANVIFLIDGTWVTPPVLDGLIGGVMRGHLIDAGMLTERSVSILDAISADAVALVSSVSGWRPAVIV